MSIPVTWAPWQRRWNSRLWWNSLAWRGRDEKMETHRRGYPRVYPGRADGFSGNPVLSQGLVGAFLSRAVCQGDCDSEEIDQRPWFDRSAAEGVQGYC